MQFVRRGKNCAWSIARWSGTSNVAGLKDTETLCGKFAAGLQAKYVVA
jgi:hypothetical protein